MCFFQGHTFFHIIARTGICWGRLTCCTVQDACWKLSAEVLGTQKTMLLCLHMTLRNREHYKEQPRESQEPLWSCINVQYHSKSRNRILLCASRHHAQQLVLNGPNTYRANSSVWHRQPGASMLELAACRLRWLAHEARALISLLASGFGQAPPLPSQPLQPLCVLVAGSLSLCNWSTDHLTW